MPTSGSPYTRFSLINQFDVVYNTSPIDVIWLPSGNLVYLSANWSGLHMITPDGDVIKETGHPYGSYGDGYGNSLAYHPQTKEIYVAHSESRDVWCFETDNLSLIERKTVNEMQFLRGISVLKNGKLVISGFATLTKRVCGIYDKNIKKKKLWDLPDGGAAHDYYGKLQPYDIHGDPPRDLRVNVDSFNRILLCDLWRNCVDVFSSGGLYLMTVILLQHCKIPVVILWS